MATIDDPAALPQDIEPLRSKLTDAANKAEKFIKENASSENLDLTTLEANVKQAMAVEERLARRQQIWQEFDRKQEEASKQLDEARHTFISLKAQPKCVLTKAKERLEQTKVIITIIFNNPNK